ncbi:MAG: ATP-binding protein [Bryobacteraceae bacterium]
MAVPDSHRAHRSLGRLFGDLKVRLKLIVLHNTFFLILAGVAYFSLIPLFEDGVLTAQLRENSLLVQLFSDERPLPKLPGTEIYDFQEGNAAALRIPPHVLQWLDENPGLIWSDPPRSSFLYRKAPSGLYRSMRMPAEFYSNIVNRAQRTLFVVLGTIYLLAVFVLELVIMPLYVYRPLRRMLNADAATQIDDRANEIIPEADILGDEIGQIMRSRNATVAELRRHEDELAKVAEDLRRNNLMLEAAKKSIEDQDRLASIGLLSASVAHEVNTPLTVLHGSIEKLMETAPDDHTRERLARMLRVTQRMRRISESLVDFARARKQEVEPVAIRPIVEEAWSLLAIDDKASRVRFHNAVDEHHLVIGNTDRLIQVFVNLLRNALNAIHSGGSINVSSESVSESGRTWIITRFEDDGPGIPPNVLPDIFDAFVTTRLDAKGTGLGLTVSDGIVRQHGGAISASNSPGGGARLEVRLPAVPALRNAHAE